MGLFDAPNSDRPCIGCEHFSHWVANGAHALCVRGGRKYVQAQPETGCVHWIRAVGADDEPLKQTK
jgi:hypothetical protein